MRKIVITGIVILLPICLLMFFLKYESKNSKPNIVLVLIDDLGWKDLGCTGSNYYQTSHIDKMASEGMIFTNGYSTSPVCSPSRGAILSGKSPARTGFSSVFLQTVDSTETWHQYSKVEVQGINSQTLEAMCLHVLPRSEITFAEALLTAGYRTGYLGKWHCGWHDNFSPRKQGFEYAEGYRNVPCFTKGHFGKRFIGYMEGLEDLQPDDDMADVLTEKAVTYIKKNKKQPFLLVLSHYAVHDPLEAKKEVVEKYKTIPGTDQNNPVYAAMVESVDKSVGRINEVLKELGIEENTLVLFTSDNGGLTLNTEDGGETPTSNFPLLGGKSMAFEAAMRVPFIVKWPAKIKAGTTNDTRVMGTDIYPTFLDAANAPLDYEQHKDGLSLLPLFAEQKISARELHFHFPHYTGYTSPYSVIIEKDWKLIKFYNDASVGFQLFDMESDPYELNNLAEELPDKANELHKKMTSWQKDARAKMPRLNPKYNPEADATWTGAKCYDIAIKHRNQAKERLGAS